MFSNVPTSAYGMPGYLKQETNVPERGNHARAYDILNYETYQSAHHEENKLIHHSSHKPDVISRMTKSGYFNCPVTTVHKDNRNIESEVITNSKRAFLPRTFSNKCNTLNKNKDLDSQSNGTQQSHCAHDNSVSNRKHCGLTYQQNGSPKTNENNKFVSLKSNQNDESDRSVWNEVNEHRNVFVSTYHSKSGRDKCRMEKSNYNKHQRKNTERDFFSDTENEGQNRCYFNKEMSPPQNYGLQQVTCLSADPLCIHQKKTEIDFSASSQESAANDHKVSIIPSSPTLLSSNHCTGNHNMESRTCDKSSRNQTQPENFRDDSEGVDALQAELTNVKEGESQSKSLSDLYSLVHSQNEQLKHLQAQVDRLLLMRDRNNSVFTPTCGCLPFTSVDIQSVKKHIAMVDESTQTMVSDIHCEVAVSTDTRPVISVGVMTLLTDTANSQQSQEVKKIDGSQKRLR
jgi:hypothetical protein